MNENILSNHHELSIQRKYIDCICQCKKTVEGRIYAGKILQYRSGDRLRLFDKQDPQHDVLCTIVAVRQYKTFREMLEQEGVERCLPGITDLEEGVAMYEAFPGYKERAQHYGVAAIQLDVIKES